jgi:dihydroorotate dehydrogenase (fumarate)
MTTSALLFHGASYISQMEHELREWMREHEYASVTQMRGAVSRDAVADPAAYERANYIGNITSYTSRFLGAQPIHLQRKH